MAIKDEDKEGVPDNKVIFPTSKIAIAALVLGILTIWPLRIFAAIPAIICGHWALREIKASQGNLSGAGFAKFGLIIGYLVVFILIVAAITASIVLPMLAHQVQETFQLQSSQSSH
jgi:hypothetical protein